MNERFRLLDFGECLELGLVDEIERRYAEWNSFVVEFPESGTPEMVGSDGGEPEDQRLYRDFKWVVPALNAAFEDGKTAGRILGAGRPTNEFAEEMTRYSQEIL